LTPGGGSIALNTPTVFNASLNFRLNWEGNFRSLEDHAKQTLSNPAIMASSADEVVSKLRADPESVKQFRDAYGREPDVATLLDAIATYERSLVTPGSRFDRWLAGEAAAITPEELSGYQLFKSLGCIS
jgi:cytochrome c peroxidase